MHSQNLTGSAGAGLSPKHLSQFTLGRNGQNPAETQDFVAVEPGEATDCAITFAGQMDLHLAAVRAPLAALDKTQCRATRHQSDDAVVVCLQPFCQLADRGPLLARGTLDVEHQQVLEIGNALTSRQLLTPAEESPDLIAELRQRLKLRFAERVVIH